MMRSPGIHMRLLVAVWAMILVIVLMLATFGGQVVEGFVRQRFEEHMGTLARYLALNAELGVILEDKEMLKRLCDNLLRERDVVAASVRKNALGEPLVHVQKQARLSNSPRVEHPVKLSSRTDENIIYDFSGEAPSRQEAVLGTVTVYYSNAGINELINGMKRTFFIIIVSVAFFFSACFYWISRSLVSPLKKLAQATQEVAQKRDLNVRVDGGHLPETRILASSFQKMLFSLAQSQADLDRTYRAMLRQQALAELGKFSMMVAHEVKNPLGIIRGALDVLKKPDLPEATQTTMTEYVENELERLNRMVEDFLRFARPRSPELEQTDVNRLLTEIADRYRFSSDDGAERIQADISSEPLWASVDVDLLSQALNNIIKNALEAASPDGRVWISSSSEGDSCEILIRDEGPGVPPEEREQIFEPFYTTKSQGTGLGLALVARVLQQHGGGIELLDTPEGGACFRITLPFRTEGAADPAVGEDVPFDAGTGVGPVPFQSLYEKQPAMSRLEEPVLTLLKEQEAPPLGDAARGNQNRPFPDEQEKHTNLKKANENWRKVLWLISWL